MKALSLSHDPKASKRLFFLHIPKTAGTSFLVTLNNAFGEIRVRRLAGLECEVPAVQEFIESPALEGLRCLAGHIPIHALGDHRAGFRVFTILRHPVDRVMSLYRFLLSQNASELSRLGLRPDFTFDMFLESKSKELFAQIRNGMCRMLCNDAAFSEHHQHVFWQDRMPVIAVEQAIQTLEAIDFGLSSRMAETLALSRQLLHLDTLPTELVENFSAPAGEEDHAGNVLRVTELNAGDLTLYREAERLFGSRVAQIQHTPVGELGAIGMLRLALGQEIRVCDLPGRKGFYSYEVDSGFSWLVGDEPARLTFAATPGRARLRMRLYHVAGPYPMEETSVAINGAAIASEWKSDDPRWGILRTAPFDARELNAVTLTVPYTIPARFLTPGSLDNRRLSAALANITLEAG